MLRFWEAHCSFLKLEKHQVISPELLWLRKKSKVIPFKSLKEKLSVLDNVTVHEVERLQPLFTDEKELEEFRARHQKNSVQRRDIKNFKEKAFSVLMPVPQPPRRF